MTVYTAALGAFALDLAGRGAAARPARAAVPRAAARPAVVPAGGPAAEAEEAPAGPPGDEVPAPPARRWTNAAGIAVSLTWLAFLLHLAGVVTRGISAGRGPGGQMDEVSVPGAGRVARTVLAVPDGRRIPY